MPRSSSGAPSGDSISSDMHRAPRGGAAAEPASKTGDTSSGDGALLGSVASGLVSVFSLQLVSRVLTFGLNIAIARSVDRKAYGVGSVQMQLVCDAVLALSREGFRDACQRTPTSDWHSATRRARVLAVAWLCVPFAAFVGAAVFALSSHFGSGQAEEGVSAAGISALFVAAAGLEMLSEPLYILAHNLLLINIRVRVEMLALASKVCTTAALVACYPTSPLRAFALGQMAYGATMVAGFSAYFSLAHGALGPGQTVALLSGWHSVSAFRRGALGTEGEEGNEGWAGGGVDWGLLGTVATMSMKAVFKFVLEKGEMFVLLQQFSPETWAMYGLVQNLASLVVRLVFLPVEDMSQLAFSKLLASGNHAAAADVLTVMVKLVVLIGSFAAAFGPAYSFTVVHLLYGSRWSSTEMPALLSWYSTYILFLALNGVTEAFVHASVSGAEMRRRSLQLVPVTAAYLGCACLFAPLVGARALIAGNCISMALRTILSLRHASALFAARGLPGALRIRELLPSPALIAVLAVCGSATWLVDRLFVGGKAAEVSRIVLAGHVLAAVVCVALCLLVQWKLDPGFVRRVKQVAVTRGKSE